MNSILYDIDSVFHEYGYKIIPNDLIIPHDDSTLFVCSGMQSFKDRFETCDGGKVSSLQSCIRTNDIDSVGDGTHLTYFEMLGNFHFRGEYIDSIRMWDEILKLFNIVVDAIHYHPDCPQHASMWDRFGYIVQPDIECKWSDGNIGGYCTEVYAGGIEIGNLVNTLGHSVDVGFGWERLVWLIEGTERIDQTSLFKYHHPIIGDHARAIEAFWKHRITPGNKKRNYVCRRLIRRMFPHITDETFVFDDWVHSEREIMKDRISKAKRLWKRNSDKDASWWWETCGILAHEIPLITQEYNSNSA